MSTLSVSKLNNGEDEYDWDMAAFLKAGVMMHIYYDQQVPAITTSFNVSSADDDNAGDWVANFTTSLADVDDAYSNSYARTDAGASVWGAAPRNDVDITTASWTMSTQSSTPTDTDYPRDVQIVRGQTA